MKVLVAGGAGFVGTSVVNDLLVRGIEVRIMDRAQRPEPGEANLEVIQGGIEDREVVQRAMPGIDVVYHLADTFSTDLDTALNTDVRGNNHLLEMALEYGVRHFIFASTHRVYGRPRYSPVDEEHPLNPEESGRALHAIFKLANEKLCLWYWQEHSLPVTIFRFWWSFSHEIGGRALRTLIDTALKGEPREEEHLAGGLVHTICSLGERNALVLSGVQVCCQQL